MLPYRIEWLDAASADVRLLISGPEQRPKSFLLKMSVVSENFGQPFPSHRLHRDAIDQTVTFIEPSIVEREPIEE